MRKPLLAHQIVSLEGGVEVVEMDADRTSHQQVLGPLDDLIIHTQEVGLLKRLKAKEVVIEVSRVVNHFVDFLVILLDDIVDVIGEEGSRSVTPVFVVEENVSRLQHAVLGALVKGCDRNAVGQLRVVRVHNGHVGASFCRQICDLLSCDSYRT